MKLKALASSYCCHPSHGCLWFFHREAETFKLNGAGATFPAPLYNSWFQDMAKETGNQVNYQQLVVDLVFVSIMLRLLTLVPVMVL